MPSAIDDVTINAPSGTTIQGPSGTTTIKSLDIQSGNLVLSGAAMSVTESVTVENGQDLKLTSGTLTAATIHLDDSTLTLSGGAINDATIDGAGIGKLVLTNSGGTLSGLTVAAGMVIDGTQLNSNYPQTSNSVNVVNGLVLNGSLLLGKADGSTSGTLNFNGTQSLSGTGVVTFGNSVNNGLIENGNGTVALTIGSGITIQGGSGSISGAGNYGQIQSVINQGTINIASGQTLTLGGIGWSNTGTITADGATVNLSGSFTTAGLGTFSAVGGTVNLTGTVDNTGNTLTLNSALGSWYLRGGSIVGGTLTHSDSSKLVLTNSVGTLNGLTVAAGMVIDGTQLNSNYPQNSNSVSVVNGLVLNGSLLLGKADGSTSGTMNFNGMQTLSGTGVVTFGNSVNNGLIENGNGTVALTIGSGITIQGGSGSISGAGNYGQIQSIINQGTINIASGQTLTLGGIGWSNTGTITADGATVNLSGSFTTAGLGTFSAVGGTVNLTGTVDNTGNTLTLNSALGSWYLRGGSIVGGTLTHSDSSKLILTNNSGTLSAVTVAAGMVIDGTQLNTSYPQNSNSVNVINGLTLNGSLLLGKADGSTAGTMYFNGTQTLGGTGVVTFGNSVGNGLIENGSGTVTLTIGSGITIQGGSGSISGAGGYGQIQSIINQGTVNIASGQTLTLGGIGWSNTGTITADGATVNLSGSFTTAGLGTFSAVGGTVNLTGTVDNTGNTLTLSSGLGTWYLRGGAIVGGTLTHSDSSKLMLTNSVGTLNGLTVAAGMVIDGTQLNSNYPQNSNSVSVVNGLVLNGSLLLGKADGSTSGTMNFNGMQTLSGTGVVTFGNSVNNGLIENGNGTVTLTIGSGITIQGGSGSISGAGGYGQIQSIINQGTVNIASGQTLTLGGIGWSNTGTITADGATVNLSGSFTTAGLGTFSAVGGTVNLTGTVDNTGNTLTLNSALGSWYLRGGSIVGGTLTHSDSSKLILTNNSGTLSAVTVAAGMVIDGTQLNSNYPQTSNSVSVVNGLVLNGSLLLGKADGSTSGTMDFNGTQTLSGTGVVTFGNSVNNGLIENGNGTVTLTIGSGITIQGGSGSISGAGNYGQIQSIINQGTVNISGSGVVVIGGSQVTLGGTLSATNGSKISVSGPLTILPQANIHESADSTIQFNNNVLSPATNPGQFDTAGTVVLAGGGTAVSPELFEALSKDVGTAASGFSNDFAIGTLVLANNTYVKIVDQNDAIPAQTVYANSIVIPTGTTLDLNGLHVYTRALQQTGTVVNGTITQIPDSGPLIVGDPTPGKISVAGELDNWTFYGRAGMAVTVVVDPGSGVAGGPVAPNLQWVQVQLLDPSGQTVLATTSNTVAGALADLADVTLPTDGTYTIAINAPSSHVSSTGNYVVTAYDVTPSVDPLQINQVTTGTLNGPYATHQWTFTATANTQVQFDLLAQSASGLSFSLTGPDGYTAFTGLTGDSSLTTLPTSGTYTLTVQGTGNAVGSFAFKVAQTGLIALTPGVPYQAPLVASGQAQLYSVTLTAPGTLDVSLTDANSQDQNEIYVSYGSPPTRDQYDYRFTGGQAADQHILISGQAGTYYILAYNNLVKAPGQYTIEAQTASFVLSGMTPGRVSAQTDNTLQFTGLFPEGYGQAGGAYLSTHPYVEFIDADGNVYPTAPIYLTPSSAANATSSADGTMTASALLPANTLAAGTYSVRVTDDSGYSRTLTNALNIVEGGVGELKTNVIVPNPIGYHVATTIYVEYTNVGDAPMAAPLLVLTATQNGVPGALLTLDASKVTAGFWTSATPDGFGQSVQFLASGSVPGVLQPGESVTVPVYYAGWLDSQWDFSRPPINFSLGVLDDTNTQAIDWGLLQSSLKPDSMSTEAWNALYPNLTSQLGNTWGEYVQQLDASAQYLASIGENVTDIGQLFNFAVQQANGYSPLSSLASATDAQVTAPGLPLSFSRTFAPGLIARNETGLLGWGWSTSWDTALTVDADGSVNVLGPNGALRRFQPDRRPGGGYFAQSGDHGVLSQIPGGGYLLTELNGQVTAYNADGTLNYVQDTDGNRITAGYTDGHMTSLTHSSGQSLTLTYDAAGHIATITDSANRVTTYHYDPSNHYLTSVVDFDGQTTSYTYDMGTDVATAHALTSITRPDGSHDYYSYDSKGRLADAHRDGGANDTTFAYNQGAVSVTDALGNTTVYSFDNRGLLIQVENPLHNIVHYTYDSNFNLTKTTDAAGNEYTNTYDNYGDLLSSTDPLGNTVAYTYLCANDRLASVTDAKGNMTVYGYDGKGNLTSTSYADGTVESVAYDPIGNVLSATDRKGQVTQYTHDPAGNVLTAHFADGTQTTFTYDAHENLTSATDASGTTTLTYDANDRLTKITYPSGRYLQYSYDTVGRRTQMVDQTGFTVNYTYDALGNLSTLTDGSGGLIVQYTYDILGRLSREDHGNGTYVTYAYDAAGELLRLINYAPDGSVNSRFDYTYDSLGRRITEGTIDGAWAYTYDAIGQLTHAVFTSTNVNIANQDLAYFYDAAGNRTQTIINGVTTTYTTNNMNEYTQVGDTTYEYDANGNQISATNPDGTTTYSFNARNQLVGVTNTGGAWTYQYDAFGNRAASTQGGVTTQYLVDPTGLGNVVATFNGGGMLTNHYTYGLGLVSQVSAGGSSAYYDFDGIGSTAGMSVSDGHLANSYSYLPFGNSLLSSEELVNPYGFVGALGVIKDGSPVTYMRARYYDSSVGQFISDDPLRLAGGDPNLRRYVFNNPVNAIDPFGLGYFEATGDYFGHYQYKFDDGSTVGFFPDPNAPFIGWAGGLPAVGDFIVSGQVVWGDSSVGFHRIGGSYNYDDAIIRRVIAENRVDFGNWYDLYFHNCQDYAHALQVAYFNFLDDHPPGDPPTDPNGGGESNSVNSFDPNSMTGPAGYGAQNFVGVAIPLPYRIDFENDPTASAPAQRVDITDQLDPNLDWKTFQWGSFQFGDTIIKVPANTQHFSTTVPMTYNGITFRVVIDLNLDPTTGVIHASFQSLNAANLMGGDAECPGTLSLGPVNPFADLPPNVLIGFLPPEDGSGRGMGSISFTVQAKSDVPTGTEIRNVALITFDQNSAIATNQVDPHDPTQGINPAQEASITIDSGTPSAVMQALAATTTTATFALNWSGADNVGGSGVASYNVYVSDNNGAYVPYLLNTTLATDTFTGVNGHTYRFYATARDNVGQYEAGTQTAEATTTLDLPAPVLAGASNITYTENGAPIAIDTALTVSTPGSGALSSATITVTSFVAGQDVLAFVNDGATMGNIAVASYVNGVLTLTSAGSTATTAQWQAALRAVTYANSSEAPSTTQRSVDFQITDGVNPSNVVTSTIDVNATNDIPVLSGIETNFLPYAIGAAAVPVTSTLQLTDADGGNMAGATIQISSGYQAGDLLAFSNTPNISGSWDAATGTLTLTGSDSVANYVTALRSVTYASSVQDPSVRTIRFQVTDGVAFSNTASRTAEGALQLVGTTLNIYGTGGADSIAIAEGVSLTVTRNGVDTIYTPSQVTAINIYGYDGNDTIQINSLAAGTTLQAFGGNGNDTIRAASSVSMGVKFDGGDGSDLLVGGAGNDTLIGGIGSDWLDGGGGSNSLAGGVGDDVYAFGDTTTNQIDTVNELADEGTDLLRFNTLTTAVTVNLTSDTLATMLHRIVKTGAAGQAANFENVNGGFGNDNITGNAMRNVIYGNGGNDTLNGGDSNDQLDGGAGNDLLIGGNGDDILSGGAGDNYLQGNAGNDILDGGDGYATLVGGTGDDAYYFFAASFNQVFTVVEQAGEGNDTLNFAGMTTAVTADLTSDSRLATMAFRIVQVGGSGQAANFENVIGGSGNDQMTGNSANNILRGNGGDDTLIGGDGNDILLGGAGNDTLKGVSGRNILIGGTGGDLLIGGTGDDLMMSGGYLYEGDNGVLNALLQEWTQATTYQTRVNHLSAQTGGLNFGFYVKQSIALDDASADYLTGGTGTDWFLASSVQDSLMDKVVDEVFTHLDL